MAHWLVKSEPAAWSWRDHAAKGVEGWTGVRNHQAAANMKAMRVGDLAFFYHSVQEKSIVGILEVVGEYEPDPTDPTGRFGMVRFRAVKPLPRPVTLAEVKSDPALARLPLIRQSRLSVMPIDDDSWKRLCDRGGAEP